jgi:hypothetical protein
MNQSITRVPVEPVTLIDPGAHQTRPLPYPEDVERFADAIEEVMSDGTHELDAIADGLNARDVSAGGRERWNCDVLASYLAELGAE